MDKIYRILVRVSNDGANYDEIENALYDLDINDVELLEVYDD